MEKDFCTWGGRTVFCWSLNRRSRCFLRAAAFVCVATWSTRAGSPLRTRRSATTTSPVGWSGSPSVSGYFAPKVDVIACAHCRPRAREPMGILFPTGNLAFHWKSMMAPPTIIDYIVVHELCHFRHLDHTEAFWNEVDKVMPDYAERKEWLRKNGAAMDV